MSLLQDYVRDVTATENQDITGISQRLNPEAIRMLHGAMGASTEANEVLDIFKKHIYYGKDLDIEHLIEEIGDVMWYLAVILDSLKVPFSDVLERNIAKTKRRYKGAFSSEAAIVRNEKSNQTGVI